MNTRFTRVGLFALVACIAVGVPARADLVQYWNFDETTGTTAANTVVGGNPAALVGAYDDSQWTTDVPAALAHSTGSLNFVNPANDGRYATLGELNIQSGAETSGATISMWLKPNAVVNDMRVFGPLDANLSSELPPAIGMNSAAQYQAYTGVSGFGWQPLTPTGSIVPAEWHHLMVSFLSNGQMVTYYDGQQTSLTYGALDFDPGIVGGLAVRFRGSYGSNFDGQMDDVAIWDSALHPTTLAQLASGVAPDAVEYYTPRVFPEYSQVVNVDFKHAWQIEDPENPGEFLDMEMPVYTGTGALPQAGTTWNQPLIENVSSDTRVSQIDAVDSNGGATDIAFHASGFDFAYGTTIADNPLMEDRIIANEDTINRWQIDGLQAGETYDLVFYGIGAAMIGVTSGADPEMAEMYNEYGWGEMTKVDDLPEDWIEGLHYAVLTVTPTGSTVTGAIHPVVGIMDDRSGFAGIQIAKHEGSVLLPGDANLDGTVDVSDLGILATNYGTATGAEWDDGDFTMDGAVDVSDLGVLATNYGTSSSFQAVPEPSTLAALFGMALCGLCCLGRKYRARAASLAVVAVAMSATATAQADLLQYWAFEDGSGFEYTSNSVAGGNTGQLMNYTGTEWSNDTPTLLSHSAGSLAFDPALQQHVVLGALNMPNDPGVTSATLSMWIKHDTLVNDTRIFGAMDADYKTQFPGALNVQAGGDPLEANYYTYTGQVGPTGSGWQPLTPAASVVTDQWHHVAMTYLPNGNILSYYDGQISSYALGVFDFDPEIPGDPVTPAVIAALGSKFRNGSYGQYFDGRLDDVAIWDTALSADAVAQLASGVAPDVIDTSTGQIPTYDQIVNVDFKFGNLPDYTGQGAVAQAGTTWNQPQIDSTVHAASVALTDAVDSNGLATTIDVTASGFEFGYAPFVGGSWVPNALFDDRLQAHSDDANAWSVGGLTVGETYDLFFYGENEGTVDITAGTDAQSDAFLLDSQRRRFEIVDDQPDDWTEGVDYVRMTVTATADTISGVFSPSPEGTPGMAFSGMQIAHHAPAASSIPEPSILVVLAGLPVVLLLRRRGHR